jgi:hypothetical protein
MVSGLNASPAWRSTGILDTRASLSASIKRLTRRSSIQLWTDYRVTPHSRATVATPRVKSTTVAWMLDPGCPPRRGHILRLLSRTSLEATVTMQMSDSDRDNQLRYTVYHCLELMHSKSNLGFVNIFWNRIARKIQA